MLKSLLVVVVLVVEQRGLDVFRMADTCIDSVPSSVETVGGAAAGRV
jgi:hypothetical protein